MPKVFKAKLIEKKEIAPRVLHLKFFIENDELGFIAGQFLQLRVSGQKRYYSIASPPKEKKTFEFVAKLVVGGAASTFFEKAKIGEEAEFFGPFGSFTIKSKDKDKIFLATGTGIAPIRSQIFNFLPEAKVSLFLFWGLKKRNDVYFFDEWKKLNENYSNFYFKICLDQEENLEGLDEKYFAKGRVQENLLKFLKEKNLKIGDFEYYVCGVPAMVEDTINFLLKEGVRKENIFFERY
jgi:Na+-transporting NADH:ubiquinone oxidoreductase subunit F